MTETDQWLAEENVVRSRMTPAPGYARPHEFPDKSGLELLSAMIAGELPRPPLADTLDFLLLRVEPGSAVFQGHPQVAHYNPTWCGR